MRWAHVGQVSSCQQGWLILRFSASLLKPLGAAPLFACVAKETLPCSDTSRCSQSRWYWAFLQNFSILTFTSRLLVPPHSLSWGGGQEAKSLHLLPSLTLPSPSQAPDALISFPPRRSPGLSQVGQAGQVPGRAVSCPKQAPCHL